MIELDILTTKVAERRSLASHGSERERERSDYRTEVMNKCKSVQYYPGLVSFEFSRGRARFGIREEIKQRTHIVFSVYLENFFRFGFIIWTRYYRKQ